MVLERRKLCTRKTVIARIATAASANIASVARMLKRDFGQSYLESDFLKKKSTLIFSF